MGTSGKKLAAVFMVRGCGVLSLSQIFGGERGTQLVVSTWCATTCAETQCTTRRLRALHVREVDFDAAPGSSPGKEWPVSAFIFWPGGRR